MNLKSEIDPKVRFIKHAELVTAHKLISCFKGYDTISGMEISWHEISLSSFSKEQIENLKYNLEKSKNFQCPEILSVFDYWVTEENQKMVYITESIGVNSLGSKIEKGMSCGSSKAVARWSHRVLEALNYLHSQQPPIVHNLINLHTIYIKPSSLNVKIVPPQMAPFRLDSRNTSCLIRPWISPEVFFGQVTTKSDIWSFGAALCSALTGIEPYLECKTPYSLYLALTNFQLPLSLSNINDPLAKDLICQCMSPTNQRPTVELLLKHPFFKQDFNNINREIIPNGIEMLFTNKNNTSSQDLLPLQHKNRSISDINPNLSKSFHQFKT